MAVPALHPVSQHASSFFPAVAPGGTLIALTVWPLLAALLLMLTPTVRREASSVTFAVAGLILTPLAVWLMPGTDPVAAACSTCDAAIPLLLSRASGEAHLRSLDLPGLVLPFLVTGCLLLALNVHSAFAVTVLCGAGTVLLAWREGRGNRKALFVWDLARTRLGGVVLGVLGASLLPVPHAPVGAVLLSVGLCMLAGLGPSGSVVAASNDFRDPEARRGLRDVTVLDIGLRFPALMLMLRLNDHPLVHFLVLVAGFGTLIVLACGRRSAGAVAPSFLSALSAIAAAEGEGAAIILLLLAALGFAMLEDTDREETALVAGSAPWPVFCALVGIGRSLETPLLLLLLACLLPMLWEICPKRGAILYFDRRNPVRTVVLSVLLVGGLMGPVLLSWHPAVGWRP